MTFFVFASLLCLLCLGFWTIILFRNNKVYAERIKAIRLASDKARYLIECGYYGAWEHSYKQFDEISYEKMLYTFWRPVDSFFDYSVWNIPKKDSDGSA